MTDGGKPPPAARSEHRESILKGSMEAYEKRYYAYQTTARGLLSAQSLRRAFEKSSLFYEWRLRDHLPRDRNATLLDVPCGYGNMLFFLSKRGYVNVSGFDNDPAQVHLARTLGLPANVGDCFEVLRSTQNTYDCIMSLDFLEHLSRDDSLLFLELCRERLRPGGALILRTASADGPFGAHDRYNDLTHMWAVTSNVLRALLGMLGFERVEILDERPRAQGVKGAARAICFQLTRSIASAFCLGLGLDPPAVWSRSMWGVGYRPTPER